MAINLGWTLERTESGSWLPEWPGGASQTIGLGVNGETCLCMCVFVPDPSGDDDIGDIYGKYIFTAKSLCMHTCKRNGKNMISAYAISLQL